MNSGLHDLVLDCDLVSNVEAYDLHRVHFADAILTLEATWLLADLQDDAEDVDDINPVVIEMGQAPDRASTDTGPDRRRARKYRKRKRRHPGGGGCRR